MDRGGPARVDGAPPALSKEDLAFHSQLYKVCTVTEVPLRQVNHSIQPRAEARCAVLVTASRWSRSFEVRAGRPVEAV